MYNSARCEGTITRRTYILSVVENSMKILKYISTLSILSVFALMSGLAYAQADDERPEGTYRISPEDVLEISVWREPDLQRQVTVRPDGGVSFPLVGDIQAAGKTPTELEETITENLAKFIPEAVVTVSVIQVQGLRVYVMGKVNRPGQFLVGRYVDVLQALTLAGGLTPFADRRNITVIRRRDGTEQIMDFDYTEVERGKNLQQNIVLQADDVVVVP